MDTGLNRLRRTAAACGVGLLLGAGAAVGDDASHWDGDARSAVRLIAGSSPAGSAALAAAARGGGGTVRAGLEIRLAAGWHTYWRYPGDAGVPPRFDFAGSQNVKSVEVLWPAPQPISEEGLTAIGYKSDVTLPLVVVPLDPTRPATLALKLDYAVCEKLCVPAEGRATLVLSGGASPNDAALAAAEARVPKKRALGEGEALAVKSVRRAEEAGRARIIVDVAAPPGTAVTLFAEGPTPDWALPVPVPVAGAPAGVQRFAFDLDGAPPGATYEGAAVTLTAVAGDGAIEVSTRLD